MYSLGSAPLSRDAKCHAAVLACGDGSALSHVSCAQLRGVTRSRERLIHVVSPRRRKVPGVRVHHCRSLSPRDITTRRGIPVTTFARMLIDLTDVQRADELANVIHEGAFHGMFSELATRDAMALATGTAQPARARGRADAARHGQRRDARAAMSAPIAG